jgi:hypothetical protein
MRSAGETVGGADLSGFKVMELLMGPVHDDAVAWNPMEMTAAGRAAQASERTRG